MFHKFLSRYGLASHLALLAAGPLALLPLLSAATLASVIFWLSGFAAVWLFVEPSLRASEHLSSARARVRANMAFDPLFWFLLVALVLALARWLNSGIALNFDPEAGSWLVREPKVTMLPASVPGAGALPFAILLAVLVVLMGIRHGIGLLARIEFGIVGSLVSGLGGGAAAACACGGTELARGLSAGLAESPFWASAFGVWLVLGIVSGAQAEARRWTAARMPFVLGLAGNAAALVFFAPPLVAAAWFVFAAFALVFSLVYLGRAGSMGAVARLLSLALFGFALPVCMVMTFMPEPVRALKATMLDPSIACSETYMQASEALSRIARQMWIGHPWLGNGLGAFGIHVPFLAEKADWAVISARPAFALNGYWTLLAERGIIGCSLYAIGIGMLLVTYVLRLVGGYAAVRAQEDVDIFPFAVPPVVWVAPLMLVPVAVEAVWSPTLTHGAPLLAVASALALAAAGFPRPKRLSDADSASSSEN